MNQDIKNGSVEMLRSEKIWKIPEWPCPTCYTGVLEEEAIHTVESMQSKTNRRDESWEPSWINGSAMGSLKCNRKSCGESICFVGDYRVIEHEYFDEVAGHHMYCDDVISPQFFYPPIPIIRVHSGYPKEIKDELGKAFSLFWNETSSCANKIRICVERILTDLKIPRYTKGKKYLALHHRIEKLDSKLDAEKKALMALKIIGNPGSHGQPTHFMDLINAFEILEHVLEKIYIKDEKRIGKVIRKYLKPK